MKRGVKPKPPGLHLVEGTHRTTRHGPEDELRAEIEKNEKEFGKPEKPRGMKGRAAKAWGRYIAPAWWLHRDREPLAIAFCELWAEFEEAPTRFQAAKLGQMRAVMAELGLSDERNRSDREDEDEFFD